MNAGLKILSASLIIACVPVAAADTRSGNADAAAPAVIERVSHELAQPEGRLDTTSGSASRFVRLYTVATADVARGTTSAPSHGTQKAQAKGATLPEPGSWAMILVGLLGVGAIARRHMSA